MAATDAARAQTGFYCSTSGTYFADLQSLSEHYKSDFHRYNLKRKVAGLPPVTKEWFEARKAQLSNAAAGSSAAAPVQRIWIDPLTKKKFNSENTYQAFVRSKKYSELVRKSGSPAPEPVIVTRQQAEEEQQQDAAGPANAAAPGPNRSAPAGFKLVAPSGGLPLRQQDGTDTAMAQARGAGENGEEEGDGDDDDDSGWETASDEEAAELAERAAAEGAAAARRQGDASMQDADGDGSDGLPEWDVRRSLFDNHMSASFQANLEYMLKKFGFYLPDAQYLRDPEGMLKYLGAKLQAGGVPLYVRGDDARSRQFRSLHAVQRHMVDTVQCKVVYDGNEEEYEEFYDYDMGQEGEDDSEAGAVVLAGAVPGLSSSAVAGYELVVGAGGGGGDGAGGAKVLGHREFARLYRQRHRPEDERQSVVVNTMLARYRALGAPTSTDSVRDRKTKAEATASRRSQQAGQLKMSMIKNVLKKLPKNCEY